jgi:hypothetical protein
MGYQAGSKLVSGSNTIEIGNVGESSDNNVIRIGTESTQTAAYIAGINGAQVTGAAVYVTSSGRLGVQASAERYKIAIAAMGANTDKLQELRPVTFHMKSDPDGVLQYGLIAEEVDRVYPELVIRDQSGKIQGVHYEELAPMLLNEVQRQQAAIAELRKQVAELSSLKKEVAALRIESRALVAKR